MGSLLRDRRRRPQLAPLVVRHRPGAAWSGEYLQRVELLRAYWRHGQVRVRALVGEHTLEDLAVAPVHGGETRMLDHRAPAFSRVEAQPAFARQTGAPTAAILAPEDSGLERMQTFQQRRRMEGEQLPHHVVR